MTFKLKNINPEKILIINTFGIGDVLFTFPMIRNLKIHFPDSLISYVANQRTAPVLRSQAFIDKVYVYERDEFKNASEQNKIQGFLKSFRFLKEIQKGSYDWAFDLSMNSSINFLTYLFGIKERIGYNFQNRSGFLTAKIPFQGYEGKHVAEYYLELLEAVGLKVKSRDFRMEVPLEDKNWAQNFLHDKGIRPDEALIGIAPGGGASWGTNALIKQWPSENYAKLVDKIIEKFPAKIILMGDQNDIPLCRQISQRLPGKCLSAAGETTIAQMAALLTKCQLTVLNDGGPLHVAVASGARTVSIFGPVDEQVYGPYLSAGHMVVKKDLPCRPCYRKFRMADCGHISCIRQISVQEVFNAVEHSILSANEPRKMKTTN